jgi:hypothetical protein
MNYYTCSISLNNYLYFYTRSYLKFQDVYANVAGLMDLLIIFISFFYQIYNRYRLDLYLCKRLITIEEENCKNFKEEKINYSLNEKILLNKEIKNYFDKDNQYDKSNDNFDYNKQEIKTLEKQINLEMTNKIEETPKLSLSSNMKDRKSSENHSNENEENIISEIEMNTENNFNFKDNQDLENKRSKSFLEDNLNENPNPEKLITKIDNYSENKSIETIEKIRSFFEMTFNKYKKFKNEFKLQIYHFILPNNNKKIKLFKKLYQIYADKFNYKFDIFHYMKLDREVELHQKILFEKDEIDIINHLSNKNFKVNLHNPEDGEIEVNKNLIIEKLMSQNLDSKQKKIRDIFIF